MNTKTNFKQAIFLKRYKRFFADIQVDSKTIVAHVPNTGSMKGLCVAGSPCLYSEVDDPNRKLKATLEAIQVGPTWVGINTSRPNKMAAEAFNQKLFSHWSPYDAIASEVKISSDSRVDLVLWNSQDFPIESRPDYKKFAEPKSPRFHFIEIKNTTLAENSVAMFPDAVTERGQKHIRELMQLIELGHTAEILFVVQRADCHSFAPAAHIDPEYARLLKEAMGKGLKITPAIAQVSAAGIELTKDLLPVAST